MTGGGGGDSLDGGAGADVFNGNDGDDTFLAQDDEADASLSGGAGSDTAYVDMGIDPVPVAVETVVGDGSPPPPSVIGCAFDAAKRAVTATLTANGEAVLVVAGGEIRFGTLPPRAAPRRRRTPTPSGSWGRTARARR